MLSVYHRLTFLYKLTNHLGGGGKLSRHCDIEIVCTKYQLHSWHVFHFAISSPYDVGRLDSCHYWV